MSGIKAVLFSTFQVLARFLWGTGLGRIPGIYTIHASLFKLLRSDREIVEIQGSKMHINPKGLPKSYIKTFQALMVYSGWEKLTTEIFKNVVKEGDVVLDLGANIGYFTLLAARLVGDKGRVYSFEPEPYNYNLLCKNIEINDYNNVITIQKAVSDTAGKLKFYISKKDTGAHSFYRPSNEQEVIEVEAVSLDEFFKDEKHPINVIKMDIEGAEMAAFMGMERIIGENDKIKIFVEFYPPAITRTGNSPDEFARRLLEDYRFNILAIGEYTKDRQYREINSVDGLLELCRGDRVANLLLEKKRS